MEALQIIGIGITAAVLSLLVKQHRPELAIVIPVMGAVLIFLYIAPYLKSVLYMFESIANQTEIESGYIKIVFKIIGVAYICQFASELCKDAGECSIASKIEFGGKIMILSMSVPVIYQLLEVVKAITNF